MAQTQPTPLHQLQLRRDSTAAVIGKLTALRQQLTHTAPERVNSVALFEVKVKHTNEVTIELGCGYFAELTAEQAIALLQRRLNSFDEQITRMSAQRQRTKEQQERAKEEKAKTETYGKARGKKLEEGGKHSYMELVGEENGEQIFNIVEIEGEEEEEAPAPAPAPAPQPTAPAQPKQQQQPTPQEPIESCDSAEQSEEEKSEKSYKSEESESESQDLIHSHRHRAIQAAKATSHKTVISSTPEIAAPKSEPQIDPAKPEPLTEKKKKKRVSFADERDGGKLEQMLKEEEQAKDKEKKVVKAEKKEEGKVEAAQEKKVAVTGKEGAGVKVSKFKQERMRERQQQGK